MKKTIVIRLIDFTGKWVEIWNAYNTSDHYDLSCKSWQLADLIEASPDPAAMWHRIWNFGYSGLVMEWEKNGANFEPVSISLPLPDSFFASPRPPRPPRPPREPLKP